MKLQRDKRVQEASDLQIRAMEVSRPLVEARGHVVSIEIEAEPIVYGDTTRLTQVFLNLLNNAAKYTPNGGRIWLRAVQEENDAVVSVRDTGIGIPEHMLSRIFDMYSQVHPEHQNMHSGLGIGLTLVKRLVELHGGSVSVRSAGPNQGTTVDVRLPVLEPE